MFILAFLCLDLLLGWQVKQLLPPASKPMPPVAQGFADDTIKRLPLLTVQTADPQDMVAELLTAPSLCANMAPNVEESRGVGLRCQGAGGDTLDQWSGLLVYTHPSRLVGTRIYIGALAVADRVLREVEPDQNSTLPLSGGAWDETANRRVFTTTEKYAGDILFNGTLQIEVGPDGITVKRFWLDVQPGLPAAPARQILSEFQAEKAATDALGAPAIPAADDGSVLLGYYFPSTEPPGSDWTVTPVWRIRNRVNQCFYINAYSGEVEATGANRLDPQVC